MICDRSDGAADLIESRYRNCAVAKHFEAWIGNRSQSIRRLLSARVRIGIFWICAIRVVAWMSDHSQGDRVSRLTPMGATVVHNGVTFRTWAPNARDVFLLRNLEILDAPPADWTPDPADRLIPLGDGTWAGFVPGMGEGAPYLLWVSGPGSSGPKRDPYARELGLNFPNGPCLVRDPARYPWHDQGWQRPKFQDLIIYQLHIGTFWAVDAAGSDRRLQ